MSNLYFLPEVKEKSIAVCQGVPRIKIVQIALSDRKIEILFPKGIKRNKKITKEKIEKLIEITESKEGCVVRITIPD